MFLLFIFLSACTEVSVQQKQSLAHIDVALAFIALQQHNSMNAKAKILTALQLAPQDANVQAAWGYYLAWVGDEANAARVYQYALRLAPGDSQILNDYAVFLYQQGQYARALQYFLRVAEDETYLYTGGAYHNASLAATKLGELALAKEYEQRALVQD
jgi:type IV pilus assembly protein PilF